MHSIDDFRPIQKGRWRTEEMLEGREALVREHLERAGLAHRVSIVNDQSAAGIGRIAGELKHSGRGVQVAFLDADHSPRGVRAEFDALEPVLDTGGFLVLHDMFAALCNWRGPRALIDALRVSGRYECLDMYLAPTNFGLGILRRVG